jgi:sulfur transfer protein SufE
MKVILHPHQYCGAHDNNIYGAIAALRETIAHSEQTNTPACILSLDFKNAFNNIAFNYLLSTMEAYGFNRTFMDRIQER